MSTKDRVIKQWIQKADNDLKSAEIRFNPEEVLWDPEIETTVAKMTAVREILGEDLDVTP